MDLAPEQSTEQFMDIIFDMVIPRGEYEQIGGLQDFIELATSKLKPLVDIEPATPEDQTEILFVERMDESKFIIYSKDQTIFDVEGKKLLIFLIQSAVSEVQHSDTQTESMPIFEYRFEPEKPRQLTMCNICSQDVLVTDEYIRMLDCNHIFHRICLIHQIAELTQKRFFLTRKEQKMLKDQPVNLCANCKESEEFSKFCKGYRKHIIFDLLKDKADLFYSKMLERKLLEEEEAQMNGSDLLSQDSENYNEDYKLMVQDQQYDPTGEEMDFEEERKSTERIEVQMQNTTSHVQRQQDEDDALTEMSESINREEREAQREEVESAYSELDQSTQNAQSSQLVAIPNSRCSVCNVEKESCIILTQQCSHQACIDCIESKITLPIQQLLETRQKISVDFVMCKAAEYCEHIMPLSYLLPLLNLSQPEHSEDIERINDMYEYSICCPGKDSMQFVDQVKWMAHCLVCQNKFCVVCVGPDGHGKSTQRLSLAQCQCVRCPQCDSANTVNRDATKSYHCHICQKNFCWSCHQQLNLCICFVQDF